MKDVLMIDSIRFSINKCSPIDTPVEQYIEKVLFHCSYVTNTFAQINYVKKKRDTS